MDVPIEDGFSFLAFTVHSINDPAHGICFHYPTATTAPRNDYTALPENEGNRIKGIVRIKARPHLAGSGFLEFAEVRFEDRIDTMLVVAWFGLVILQVRIGIIDERLIQIIFARDPELIVFFYRFQVAAGLWEYYEGENPEIIEITVVNEFCEWLIISSGYYEELSLFCFDVAVNAYRF